MYVTSIGDIHTHFSTLRINIALTLSKIGFFGAAHGWEGGRGGQNAPLPKICHTYPAIMKLGTAIPYLKKIQKNIRITSCNTPTFLLTSAIFYWKSANFAYIKKCRYRLNIDIEFLVLLTYLQIYLRISLIYVVAILMMSAKMVTLDLLKIKVYRNKGYDIIICVHDFTNKILSRDLICTVDVVM